MHHIELFFGIFTSSTYTYNLLSQNRNHLIQDSIFHTGISALNFGIANACGNWKILDIEGYFLGIQRLRGFYALTRQTLWEKEF